MKRQLITLVAVFGTLSVLATARSASAKDPAEEQAIAAGQKGAAATAVAPAVAPANQQTAVMCQTCFTCGGDWPIFSGATHAVNTGGATFERGAACSGPLASSNDINPFLCCR